MKPNNIAASEWKRSNPQNVVVIERFENVWYLIAIVRKRIHQLKAVIIFID